MRCSQRRGAALVFVLMLTLALGVLAGATLYTVGNATRATARAERERVLRDAADGALALGTGALRADPRVLPDSGFRELHRDLPARRADGERIAEITSTVYTGPTRSSTGDPGRFVSVVAIARDGGRGVVVRRLELARESFAQIGNWSEQEPVIGAPIRLPTEADVAQLAPLAAARHASFVAPNAGSVSAVAMRVELVAPSASATPANGVDDGFFRVYVSRGGAGWLRGDFSFDNCGAAYVFRPGTSGPGSAAQPLFVPLSEHAQPWFRNALTAASAQGVSHTKTFIASVTSSDPLTLRSAVLGLPSARCHLGGDPNLRAVNLRGTSQYASALAFGGGRPASDPAWTSVALRLGGSDTTFDAGTPSSTQGYWLAYPGPVDARLRALYGNAGAHLFPLQHVPGSGADGIIHVVGTVGVSGVVRGRVTLYATGNVALLDDVRYATDPALEQCRDVLGVIAGRDIVVADNALQTPVPVNGAYRALGASRDVTIHGVSMALGGSFVVENLTSGPSAASPGIGCETTPSGRGCLHLTGSVIQRQRGVVGLASGEGFVERQRYDRCASRHPPPHFPMTGRFTERGYHELAPSGFDAAALFRALAPEPDPVR